jgi:hypothetical protein
MTIGSDIIAGLRAAQEQLLAEARANVEANAQAARNRVPRNPGRATFQNISTGDEPFEVHFNPTSLQIALANTLDDSHSGGDRTQFVSKSSAKLTMDLIFDSTDTGANVREDTAEVAAFMEATGSDNAHRTPPTVLFEWGAFKFQGIFESYRETIDFFSHDGVPLRASVNLTISRQSVVFDDDPPSGDTRVDLPPTSGNASEIASRSGNPDAGRGIAAANGLESMRFSTKPISIDASVAFKPPAGLVSGGAGISLGASVGIGAGASASASASGSLSLGAKAGAGTSSAISGPSFGGSASAGLSATKGAFAGLRTSAQSGGSVDPTRLIARPQPRAVATGPQASFGIGGQALSTGSASLGTDVGVGSPQTRVRFDGGR